MTNLHPAPELIELVRTKKVYLSILVPGARTGHLLAHILLDHYRTIVVHFD